MKNKNEEGYALLIVLFLVVIIMIISTTFVRANFVSNAKQGKNVDENNLSVVVGEMGVDYYKTATINAFNLKKIDLMVQAQNEINTLVASKDFSKKTPAEIKISLYIIRKNL